MNRLDLPVLSLSACAAASAILLAAIPNLGFDTKFVDVAAARGVTFRHASPHTSKKYLIETMGSGAALFDYDNDGLLDLFLVNGAALRDPMIPIAIPEKENAAQSNRLYHQKPDGNFEDVTEKAGLAGAGFGMGVAVADFDNDGFQDLYVTGYGGNHLYKNNGNGSFTDVTSRAGVAGSGWSTSAAWVDLDNDGLLDLVVLRYLDWNFSDIWCGEHKEGYRAYCHPDLFKPVAPLVFHNEGNGRFSDWAAKSGIVKAGKSLGIAISDYDRDGRIDLAVANDSMPEFLYHNLGGGRFEEIGLASEMAVDEDGRTYAGMGIDFADYDNDGFPDIVIDSLSNQNYALYRNEGADKGFAYASKTAGLAPITYPHSGWGLRFLDFDNDGWKDLLVAQGHDLDTIELTSPQLHYREPLLLARNNRGRFTDVSAAAGAAFQEKLAARGLATGDFDNDGRMDAVVTTNDGQVHLLHNETATNNHWLILALNGTKSNRDGIGAAIKVTSGAGSQYATVSTAGSYLSSSDKRVHFGLGSNAIVSSIEIRWPSGQLQVLKDVRADRVLRVAEPNLTH